MTKRTPPRGDRQTDLFVACFADIPVRDQREAMERPFFSLAKKPRLTPIDYHVGEVWVKVTPSAKYGMATIWDADVLIWAATQVIEARDRGLRHSRTLEFHPYTLLKGIRRGTSGREYDRLRESLRRLAATYIETNIRAPGKKRTAGFHWLEGWKEVVVDEVQQEETKQDGDKCKTKQIRRMTLTLADWFYDGILAQGGVLTIHEDYFLLTGGVERWLYRVARKHAGSQEHGWQFTMRQLYEKSGSAARFSDFAIDIRNVAAANDLPEYTLVLYRNEEGDEVVTFLRRSRLSVDNPAYQFPRHPRRRIARGIYSNPPSPGGSKEAPSGPEE